jgi:hypothetical protein
MTQPSLPDDPMRSTGRSREVDGSTRRIAVFIVSGMVGLTLIILFLLTPSSPERGPVAVAPPASVAATDTPLVGAMAPLEGAVTVVGGRFDQGADRSIRNATAQKNQSKLFFADGQWWGVLHEPVSREAHIQRLDWATQRWHDTGLVVDERPYARADALFADGTLYVATAGTSVDSPTHAVRVVVFDLDPATDRWTIRPDYPVTISDVGVEAAMIDRGADGTLWVAYIRAGELQVAHTLKEEHGWTPPYRPNVSGTEVATDQVGIIHVGHEIVLLWSNQEDEAIYAASHRDGDPDDTWVDESRIVGGFRAADDHVNVKVLPDGRVFAVVKTSMDTVPGNQPGWDQVLLLDRVDGEWSSQQFSQIRDKHTRPIILLDTEHEVALVFATAPVGGGSIYMKRGPFDDLRFPVGRGVPVLDTPVAAKINNATSTKQAVDASTGLVVLASDDSVGRYVHLAASLGGPLPGTPAGPPPDGPVPPPAGDAVVIVDEPNDAYAAGTPVQPIWRMSPTRQDGTVTYEPRSAGDMAIQLRTTGPGELRPCHELGPTSTGRITMAADVRLDREGPADTILLMGRGEGQEIGSLRVDPQRRVRVSFAGDRETTDLRLQRGAWFRAELDFDLAGRTFDARLLDAKGRTLLDRSGLGWRADTARVIDGLCVAASVGRSGLGLALDGVRVTRTP